MHRNEPNLIYSLMLIYNSSKQILCFNFVYPSRRLVEAITKSSDYFIYLFIYLFRENPPINVSTVYPAHQSYPTKAREVCWPAEIQNYGPGAGH